MRNLIFTFLAFATANCYGQTFRMDLSEKKINENSSIKHSVVIKGKDTADYIYFHFQNAKYSHIIDIGSLLFMKNSDKDSFISTLKSALKYINKDGLGVEYAGNGFTVRKSEEIKGELYIASNRSGKYTWLKESEINAIIEFCNSTKLRE